MPSDSYNPADQAETIYLVHGLGGTALDLGVLAARLTRPGSQTVIWRYPSLAGPIERFAANLADELQRRERTRSGPIHLVTHSMGCIVTRAALCRYRPANLGRWVMLAPPNRGSHVARRWIGRFAGRWIPAIQQLSDRQQSYVNQLSIDGQIQFGVIAAKWDWMVPLRSTHLDGERDHVVIPTIHTGVLFRRDVARCIRHFLDHGTFSASEPVAPDRQAAGDAQVALS